MPRGRDFAPLPRVPAPDVPESRDTRRWQSMVPGYFDATPPPVPEVASGDTVTPDGGVAPMETEAIGRKQHGGKEPAGERHAVPGRERTPNG